MEWLMQFDALRARGQHAFLFVGSAGDGFPRSPADAASPVDALDPWAETMAHHLAGTQALVVTFDVARGLTFRSPEDEQAFHVGACGDAPSPSPQNAVARARATRPTAWPWEPAEALDCLRLACTRFATATGNARRSLAIILPDVDAMVPDAATMATPSSAVPLTLLRLLESDAFRRCGHCFLMSAPTTRSVDERLRRPDAPIAVIAVSRPTEQERDAFIASSCATELTDLQRERAIAAQALAEARSQVVAKAEVDRAQAAAAMRDHAAREAALVEHDAEYQRLERIYQELAAQQQRARDQASTDRRQREHALVQEHDVLVKRFLLDAALAIVPMTDDRWSAMEVGDALQITVRNGSGQEEVIVKHVLERKGDGCVLSRSNDPHAPHVHHCDQHPGEHHPKDHLQPMLFFWKCGMVHGRRLHATKDPEPMPIPEGSSWTVMYVPRERFVVQARLATIEQERERLEVESETVVTPIDGDVPRAAAACAARRAIVLAEWQREGGVLRAAMQEAEACMANPASPEMDRCARELHRAEQRITAASVRGAFALPDGGSASCARLMQGFGYRDMVAVLRSARAERRPATAADVLTARQAILRRSYGDLFEIVDPEFGFAEIAGCDHVKRLFARIRDHIRAGNRSRVPMGVQLLGPPGVGKSAIAMAFARECGFLFVRMKNIREPWVGASEARYERALHALRELAPVVWFRDEVDRADAGRDTFHGDSGVSLRIQEMTMEFLADPAIRGRVLALSASNHPARLEAALVRAGRTDERLAMLFPDEATIAALLRIKVRQHGFPCAIDSFAPYAASMRWWPGGLIEKVVRVAYDFAEEQGRAAIDDASLRAAIADTIPPDDHELEYAEMTRAAISATSNQRHLPADVDQQLAWAEAVLRKHGRTDTHARIPVPVRSPSGSLPA
ncbi:ATP-binding protein [Candidatus Uhrbacteria bacterium]|nr:ATP-binding protein [Candidatus Uhrbacteria bacterium]